MARNVFAALGSARVAVTGAGVSLEDNEGCWIFQQATAIFICQRSQQHPWSQQQQWHVFNAQNPSRARDAGHTTTIFICPLDIPGGRDLEVKVQASWSFSRENSPERTGLFIIMYYASNQPLNSELVASLRLASVRLLDAGHAASGCPRARVSLAAGKNPAWEVYFLFWTPDSEKQRTGGLSRLHFTLFLVLVGSFAHMQSEGKSVKVVSLATPLILQNFLDVKVQGTADP